MTPRQQIAAVAYGMLDGSVDLHEGCWKITRLQHSLSNPDAHNTALLFIIGVDSELDHCPRGSVRQYWEPSALAEKDRERDEYLRRINDHLMKACLALATWR